MTAQTIPHYCTRCGAAITGPQDPHLAEGQPCHGAAPVLGSELVTGEGVRCPINGCGWMLKAQPNRSNLQARQLFDSHLEWHQRQAEPAPAAALGAPLLGLESANLLADLALSMRQLAQAGCVLATAIHAHAQATARDPEADRAAADAARALVEAANAFTRGNDEPSVNGAAHAAAPTE